MSSYLKLISEIKEITDPIAVNELLQNGWVLLEIVPTQRNIVYVLGKK